jgi:2'-5' RNA ligase
VNQASEKSRVFFALWPEPDVRARLHQETLRLHRRLGGKPTHPDTLHLTLVFIGDVENSLLKDLAATAARIDCPGFELEFDREACWHHNHIAHIGIDQPPTELFELVDQIASHLKVAGISFDVRPYTPHITLVRKADCARFISRAVTTENPALEPIRWLARDFVLVRSSLRSEGARYEQLGRWPLL